MKTVSWSFLLFGLVFAINVNATLTDWPQEIPGDQGSVLVYQPQIESFKGNSLEARAAIAIQKSSDSELVFGAIWMKARVSTDKEQRLVILREIEVTDIQFTDSTEGEQEQLGSFIESNITNSQLSLSLDQLLADLDASNGEVDGVGFKSDAPKIFHATEPTVLVTIDGTPVFRDIENTSLSYVVNSPFLLVNKNQDYYLFGGSDTWYSSSDVLGPWSVSASVPKDVAETARDIKDDETDSDAASRTPPKIIVSTVPAELIVSVGEPTWSPVKGMELLYMDNTDSDVFIELSTQNYFVVLSGRWFRSPTFDSDSQWQHVPNDELPLAFADIPENSPNGHVLAQVSGTPQAREAILENTIPQTAAILRDDNSFKVDYDGDPVFKEVEKIRVYYAVNTAAAVFRVGDHYYACEQGVWYESDTATGPWRVATTIPVELYNLPPSNPHYNVRYVRVYDVTPDVVYVGYTPGYYGSYYYRGAIVYGTGWYYHPWYRSYYYPHQLTWGFHVRYYPWYGWRFGAYWRVGPFTFGFGFWRPFGYHHYAYYPHRHHGWFGVGGYHPYHRPSLVRGYRKSVSTVSSVGAPRVGKTRVIRTKTRTSIYSRPQNQKRVVVRTTKTTVRVPRKAARMENNVFTDRSGGVYRRSSDGAWQRRSDGKWRPAENLDRSTRSSTIHDKTLPKAKTGQVKPKASKPKAAKPDAVKRKSIERKATRPSPEKPGTKYKQPVMEKKSAVKQQPTVKKPGKPGQRSPRKAVGEKPTKAHKETKSHARRPQLERDYRSREKGASQTKRFKQSQSHSFRDRRR